MKKYIRTLCNIFEVIDETELVYKVIGASREQKNVYSRSKVLNDVIDQDENIEKLLDFYVFFDEKGVKRFAYSNTRYLIDCFNVFGNVFGMIWVGNNETPKLKAVAKIKSILPNGNIEWELI